MSSLILDSLEIKNFRAFRHLQIERLGRVNLIVGQNNVGKTCLLEALWLYGSRGSPDVMQQILADRNEFALIEDDQYKASAIKYLFYGRNTLEQIKREPIKIGRSNDSEHLSVLAIPCNEKAFDFIVEFIAVDYPNAKRMMKEVMNNGFTENAIEIANFSALRLFKNKGIKKSHILPPYNKALIVAEFNKAAKTIDESFKELVTSKVISEVSTLFIPYKGVEQKTVAQWWDSTYLTDSEDDVLAALHIIEPKIRRIGLVDNRQQKGQRVPMVRLSDSKSPVLLSSLGQGMNHLFALALALVNAENGFLLIDEVENGIYHGTQPDLWRFIFKMAQRLNVQVFATTHSRDSLEAFHEALQEDEETDGLLISLRNKQGKPGEVVGVLFERENLEIITDQQIEVR